MNASAVVVPKYGAEIAEALAQRLGESTPTRPEDRARRLSAFREPEDGGASSTPRSRTGLKTAGAEDVTAKYAAAGRGRWIRAARLICRPTIVRTATPSSIRWRTSELPLPVRGASSKCRSAKRCSRRSGLVARRHRDHQGSGVHLDNCSVRRSSSGSTRAGADDEDIVGSAARGNMFEFLYRTALDRARVNVKKGQRVVPSRDSAGFDYQPRTRVIFGTGHARAGG